MPTMHAPETADIIIRDVAGQKELRAVENLQKEVWGIPELEVVPTTQLVAAQAAGGVLLGAFDGATLAGFAYGFPGYERGRATHHSHMLAVKSAYRSCGLGRKLKLAQRERVLSQGIAAMTWTFDPLQSLNAHFNFGKLGVIADRYLANFYGADAASFLHRNGTDRLWVTWKLASRRVSERVDRADSDRKPQQQFAVTELGRVAPLVSVGNDEFPQSHDSDERLADSRLAIEIPADINALERQSGELAAAWREATRRAFTKAIASDFVVEDFYRRARGGWQTGIYLLTREKSEE